jgi:glycosyltransferase involved in cell wall biosynthesis
VSRVALFDEQCFVRQERGGISRFFVETILRLEAASQGSWSPHTNWPLTINEHAEDAALARRLQLHIFGHRLRKPEKAVSQIAAKLKPPGTFDLVHATYYATAPSKARKRRPLVTTVFDMTPERFPELFTQGNPHLAKRDYVTEADLVVCISEATHRDVLEFYGEPRGQVVTIPWGVGDEFTPLGPCLEDLAPGYVLFVGQRSGYKDFGVLIEAFRAKKQHLAATPLVIVGGPPLSQAETQALEAAGVLGRTRQIWPTDRQLPAVYRGAKLFVFPSRYEGFGLPTLEAMASGVPTILAHSSSHVEVGGDAALFFEPGNAEHLAHEISSLLTDSTEHAARRELGLTHAATFSWDTATRALASAYSDLLG